MRERKEENCVLVLFIKVPLSLRSGTLCWHNFDHNRETRALRNNASIIADLKAELATYMACCGGVSAETPICDWWRNHQSEIPKWANACKCVLLCQPSSAAAERVFSLLNNSYSGRQSHSLEDYIETSVMLQYNRNS